MGGVSLFHFCYFKLQIFISPLLDEKDLQRKTFKTIHCLKELLRKLRGKDHKFMFAVDLLQASKDFMKSQGKSKTSSRRSDFDMGT